MLHGLAGAHDAHAADLALELDALVGAAGGRGHGVRDHGKVVEPLLDEQADDAVAVEDEVAADGGLVTDHARGALVVRMRDCDWGYSWWVRGWKGAGGRRFHVLDGQAATPRGGSRIGYMELVHI